MNRPDDFELLPNGFPKPIQFSHGCSCGDADPGIGVHVYHHGFKMSPRYLGGAMTIDDAKRLRNWLDEVIAFHEANEPWPTFEDRLAEKCDE